MNIINYLLYLYRKSNMFGQKCRFYPSCSYYAEESIQKYGFFKGGYLALLRLIRCNQLFPGGYDPVE